jgi:AhpD family alkylhydroperoxidase
MSQSTQYRDAAKAIGAKVQALQKVMPDTMKAFNALKEAAAAPGTLDTKTKELIALALGVAAHCEACVAFHAQFLAKLGATREEVSDALGMAVLMGGGPSMMWSAEALSAFDEFKNA